MIRSLCLVAGLCTSFASAAALPDLGSKLDLSGMPISAVLSVYYKEVNQRPYFICGDVLTDARTVSVRATGKTLDGALIDSLLATHGFEALEKDGLIVVCKKSEKVVASQLGTTVYRVKHRDSGYLVDFLSPLVSGTFANKRAPGGALTVGGSSSQVSQTSGSSSTQGAAGGTYRAGAGDDFVVFSGLDVERAKVEKLLAQLDVPRGQVMVKAYMYEVGKSANDASAFDLMLSALRGKVSGSMGSTVVGNAIRLKVASIELVASALSTDGRFKVVTSPKTVVKSGSTARFVSGAQVPVLGAIVTSQGGSTQQSYDRIESGTILEVQPVLREDSIEVDIFQQVSSFVNTETGGPPTLNKRELRTSLVASDGEVFVIAGLDEVKEDNAKSGLSFLPFPLSKSRSSRSSELLLVLELKKL